MLAMHESIHPVQNRINELIQVSLSIYIFLWIAQHIFIKQCIYHLIDWKKRVRLAFCLSWGY